MYTHTFIYYKHMPHVVDRASYTHNQLTASRKIYGHTHCRRCLMTHAYKLICKMSSTITNKWSIANNVRDEQLETSGYVLLCKRGKHAAEVNNKMGCYINHMFFTVNSMPQSILWACTHWMWAVLSRGSCEVEVTLACLQDYGRLWWDIARSWIL